MQRTEPTQRTEPPELTPDVREVLLNIADRLATIRPHGAMTEALRMAKALHFSEQGRHIDAALALNTRVLAHMPAITGETTRGEYAVVLRSIAKGGAR